MSTERSIVFAALMAAGASVGTADAGTTKSEFPAVTAISGSLEPSAAIRSQIAAMLGRTAEDLSSNEAPQHLAEMKLRPKPKKPPFAQGGRPTPPRS